MRKSEPAGTYTPCPCEENHCSRKLHPGTLELSGVNLMYEGTRVKSWLVGRDMNPGGRGDGSHYALGDFTIGNIRPVPTTTPVGGWGNSVNNQAAGFEVGDPIIPGIPSGYTIYTIPAWEYTWIGPVKCYRVEPFNYHTHTYYVMCFQDRQDPTKCEPGRTDMQNKFKQKYELCHEFTACFNFGGKDWYLPYWATKWNCSECDKWNRKLGSSSDDLIDYILSACGGCSEVGANTNSPKWTIESSCRYPHRSTIARALSVLCAKIKLCRFPPEVSKCLKEYCDGKHELIVQCAYGNTGCFKDISGKPTLSAFCHNMPELMTLCPDNISNNHTSMLSTVLHELIHICDCRKDPHQDSRAKGCSHVDYGPHPFEYWTAKCETDCARTHMGLSYTSGYEPFPPRCVCC